MQATCKGVLKLRDLASTLDPYSINNSIKLTWPSLEATCNGVHPSELHWLISACVKVGSSFFNIFRQPIMSSFSVDNQIWRKSSLCRFFSWFAEVSSNSSSTKSPSSTYSVSVYCWGLAAVSGLFSCSLGYNSGKGTCWVIVGFFGLFIFIV